MSTQRSRIISLTALIVAIVVGIFLVSAAISFYIITVKVPTDLAHEMAAGVKQVFNFTPRTMIRENVVIEQQTPITELATVSRSVYVDYSWKHTWVGSTKELQLTGAFTVKAGFDLQDEFVLTVIPKPLHVTAALPPPKVLSVQMDTFLVVRDESGWWNKISGQDRQNAVNELRRKARAKAESSGILDDARADAEASLRKIAGWSKTTMEFLPPAAGR
jgi:hypothetical protein